MPKITHVNIMNDNDQVYCHKVKKVVEFNELHQKFHCEDCPMFAGTAQGQGVDCVWDDPRKVSDPHMVTNPKVEKDYVATAEAVARRKK